jgi:hypothetical protein
LKAQRASASHRVASQRVLFPSLLFDEVRYRIVSA